MQSVPITTKVVSSNPAHGEVYWIQLYGVSGINSQCGNICWGFLCGDRMVVGFITTCAISTYRTYLLHMDVQIFILIKQLYKQGVEIHIILFTTLPCAVAK